ncbi:membrane protein insertase YidC [Terrihabitans rhizophilus]|uniref:Membrane protein insertase YidC n=1 Tax=Terrihabitans rhizophilus TaxID=3092662 RepID=A0ABU4RL70_9HYPH|nr:membrane protein insertase YidC [Terrihabitans sp. PJ23]MDX6804475.1 membrane protein insertase YidC [Terrihabitans sp. PJ23]
MSEHRNLIIAIAMSIAVLGIWEYFYGGAQREKEQLVAEQQRIERGTETPAAGAAPAPQAGVSTPPPVVANPGATREQAVASGARIPLDTAHLSGSISLIGGRIDDVQLKDYRETVEPNSPNIVLLTPPGGPQPFYAEHGWVAGQGTQAALPGPQTPWTQEGAGTLTAETPITLRWDNGAGLVFRRTIAVDPEYMFTVTDRVENTGSAAVTLHPYALVSRHGRPKVAGYYILHEGMLGFLGDDGLQEIKYDKLDEEGAIQFSPNRGWLGITDKYWATAIVPPQNEPYTGRFAATKGEVPTYQGDYLLGARTVEPGATSEVQGRLFAGAKETRIINAYGENLSIPNFDLMIDWGWFYFLTKPMFWVIDFFYHLVGNFGVAILIVTVLVKAVFYPLASKSYASMSKMKLVQPELVALRERYKDDKAAQQKAMMELYKAQKINPAAGCLPILIQIPVFFALYKVIFITIEMRHAPFFGWIRDLSAPDPTTIFNLFGLLPYDPGAVPVVGHFLMLGVWPIIMGITMFVQMRLNPLPPDPTQAMLFTWMPVFFTFLLSSFPAGLVIYWSWNNTLSVLQQATIMRRQGVKIELFDNIKGLFQRKPKPGT